MGTLNLEANQILAERIIRESHLIRNSFSEKLQVPVTDWVYTFEQYPKVNEQYSRLFFWRCDTVVLARLVYQMFNKKEIDEETKDFNISQPNGYFCMYLTVV